MSASDYSVAARAVACFYSLWWCLSLARRLHRSEHTTKTDRLAGVGSVPWLETERWPAALRSGRPMGLAYFDLELRQLAEAACRKAKAQGGDCAIVASVTGAASWAPPVRGAAAPGPQARDCTPEPIDDEATAPLNLTQAQQVQRLVTETARP